MGCLRLPGQGFETHSDAIFKVEFSEACHAIFSRLRKGRLDKEMMAVTRWHKNKLCEWKERFMLFWEGTVAYGEEPGARFCFGGSPHPRKVKAVKESVYRINFSASPDPFSPPL